MTTLIEPPEDLSVDPSRRVVRCLAVPFGEAVVSDHEDAGKVFTWGDVYLPAPGTPVPVNLDHDPERIVGHIVESVKTHTGIWSSIKLGDKGANLAAAGSTGISPEVDDHGNLIALALCLEADPSMPSAKIVDVPSFPKAEAPAERASVPSFPLPRTIGEGRFKAEDAPKYSGPAWGQVGESKTIVGSGAKACPNPEWEPPSAPFDSRPLSMSMADMEAEVRRERERFAEQRATPDHETWWQGRLREIREQGQELHRRFEREQQVIEEQQRRRDKLTRAGLEFVSFLASPPRRRWWQWRS